MRQLRQLGALVIVVALTACGTQAAPSASGGQPDGSDGGDPAPSGTLIVSIAGDPTNFNTNYVFDNFAYYTDRNIYGRLIGYDYTTGELFGDLATEWTASEDSLSYTISLREGVTWHDGEPFTADDVVWTYQDIIDTGESAYTHRFVTNIESIEAEDDHTVVFTLKEPDATFATALADYYAPIILPAHIYEGTDATTNEANQAPIGTGPFTFVSQTVGDRVVMERNPDYYGTQPEFQELVFRVIPNRATAISALRSGEIGYSSQSPAFGETESLKEAEGIEVDETISNIIQWIGFNLDNEILADPNVRRAISHAINNEQINDQAYFGLATPSVATYLTTSWAYDPTALQPEFDPAEAERLLDEAGYPVGEDGTRFELKFVAFNASIYGGPEAAAVVQQQLAEVGIEATIDLIDVAVLNQQVFADRDFDLVTIAGLHGPNPQAFATLIASTGSLNAAGYDNPRVDEIFAEARQTADRDEQAALYGELQQILAEDLPRFNMVEYVYLRPHRDNLSGFWWEEGSGSRGIGLDMYNGVTGVAP